MIKVKAKKRELVMANSVNFFLLRMLLKSLNVNFASQVGRVTFDPCALSF